MSRTLLAGMTAALLALLLFAWLAANIAGGNALPFDQPVRAAIHSWASPGLTGVMRNITRLGSDVFLIPAGALAVIALLRAERRRDVRLFLAVVLGAELLSELLKLLFHRARPEPFFGFQAPHTYSFPSGHSLVSPCFYGVLAAIVAPRLRRPAARAAVWACAAMLAVLIGCSRIYLGVHYPSDVLAGYAVAVAWAAGLGAAIEWRRRTPPRNRV